MRFKYKDEHLAFLRKGYQKMRRKALTAAFNEKFGLDKSESSVKQALQTNGITCDRKPGLVKGERSILFTKEQVAFIKEQYKIYSHSELTIEFNKRFQTEIKASQIRSFVHNQGIQCGRNGRFGIGHVSWNKGIKGYIGPNATSFKKGSVPPNRMPLGSERITKDGYVWVKINEPNPYVKGQMTRWKQKNMVVWVPLNGPVPEGHMLTFLDGDKTNCEPDNLMMISRKVNAYLNCNDYGSLTGELKLTAIKLAKLAQKASQLEKEDKAA